MADDEARGAALEAVRHRARVCVRCPALVASRTQVVAATGPAGAAVLFVTPPPGRDEDVLGRPLVGRSGELLERLLADVGMGRGEVVITPLARCRPGANREVTPVEVAACSEHLRAELLAVRPVVVVALGSLVTRVLRGDPAPIRRRRGREEPCLLGLHPCWLLPVFHPEAALYDADATEQLRADLARLPRLVARGRPELTLPSVTVEPERAALSGADPAQLELF